MSTTFTPFNKFKLALGSKKHNLTSDTLKCMLTNTAPNAATDDEKADIVEITAEHGYSAGGAAITSVSWSESGGTVTLAGTGPTITASGGTVGPFRYIVVYNETATNDDLIGYLDYGTSITLQDGQPFAISFPSNLGTLS